MRPILHQEERTPQHDPTFSYQDVCSYTLTFSVLSFCTDSLCNNSFPRLHFKKGPKIRYMAASITCQLPLSLTVSLCGSFSRSSGMSA